MKLKTATVDGTVYAVLEDGKPIYVYDDGKEVPYDAAAAVNKIRELNAEAKNHREEKEAAQTSLKKFEGIEDPDAARTALETIANLDQGKLVAAGKVEEIKAAAKKTADEQVLEVRKGLEQQITGLTKENSELKTGWDRERIGTEFANSKFIAGKLAHPPAMIQKIFGENFKIEDGRPVGYLNGQLIYSRENHGTAASFDEALSEIVNTYPFRDSLVRGSGGGSGGGQGAGNGGNNGEKIIGRAEFEKMEPSARFAKMQEGYAVSDQ